MSTRFTLRALNLAQGAHPRHVLLPSWDRKRRKEFIDVDDPNGVAPDLERERAFHQDVVRAAHRWNDVEVAVARGKEIVKDGISAKSGCQAARSARDSGVGVRPSSVSRHPIRCPSSNGAAGSSPASISLRTAARCCKFSTSSAGVNRGLRPADVHAVGERGDRAGEDIADAVPVQDAEQGSDIWWPLRRWSIEKSAGIRPLSSCAHAQRIFPFSFCRVYSLQSIPARHPRASVPSAR